MWGLAEDQKGNEDYGYIKMTIDFKRVVTDKEYKGMQEALVKLLPFGEDVIAIGIQEYLDNTECDNEELETLLNYKNAEMVEHQEKCPCMEEESLHCGMKCSICGREL